MMTPIDYFLNRITMYRLIVYYLLLLLGAAVVMSFAGLLPYNPVMLVTSVAFLVAVCWLVNTLFAKTFHVPANVESFLISALILALIISPAQSTHDLWFLTWAAVWAMASKYMLAIKHKHIFNPVAFAVTLTALTINQSASWWVGSGPMLPFVLVGGLLIVRKTRRFGLVTTFLITWLTASLVLSYFAGSNVLFALQQTVLYSPLFFFGFVFITEPLTMPPTQNLRILYGLLVGILASPQVHFGSIYLTPEQALLIGNLFSYLVSPKARLVLRLKDRIKIAPDIYDFIFEPQQKLAFAPGQYMEWTLGHEHPDSRGNRRYFTLASSPTESTLRLGVKFYPESSSYKQSMLAMNRNSEIVASQLAGDFTLPNDPSQRLIFIAGGIGITPFRSMVQYLVDKHLPRRIVLFYACRTADEFVYQDVFEHARATIGLKTVYTLTDEHRIPKGWTGRVGHIDERMIKAEAPAFRHCIFYLSGPNTMVNSFEKTLRQMSVEPYQIRKDFFPGFA